MNTSNLSTIVSPSIMINGNNYIQYAQIGMVIKETLTEELDSATLILNNVTRTLFEAFDEVVITLENNKKYYMYVNTSSEAIFNYEAHTYSYTLQLISQTKILERIILPNLKIRHSLNGQKNTIQWYVEKVVLPYITRQVNGITMSLRFSSFTARYDCPEIEWNHPTAKQVLNDLLGTISNNPSLIKITNHKLDYVNLAREGIDCSSKLTHIVKDEQYEQMQDFANNITMDVQNAIPKDSNCRAIVSPRAEGKAQVTSDNITVVIPNARIENISSLKVVANIRYERMTSLVTTETVNEDYKIDITKYVVEESIYKILPETTEGIDHYDRTKNNCLFFKKGDNKIYCNSTSWLMFSSNVLKTAILYSFEKETYDNPQYFNQGRANVAINSDIRNIIFDIEFTNATDSRIKVVKDKPEKVDASLYVQQNQSAIDLVSLTQNQRENANRLGNELYVVDAIFFDYDIPSLNDFVIRNGSKYYLAQREIAYKGEYALFKGTFSKDYIQKNNYYGISSRRRFTQLAQANESVVREEHIRKRIILTNSPSGNNFTAQKDFCRHALKVLDLSATDLGISSLVFGTSAMTIIGKTLPTTINYGDKSIFISGQCEDNYSIGLQVTDTDFIQDYVSYVDSNGEMTSYTIEFYKGWNADRVNNIDYVKQVPNINLADGWLWGVSGSYYKDNAETFKITFQFDFEVAEAMKDKILIGNGIGRNNGLSYINNNGCKWVYSNDELDFRLPIIEEPVTCSSSVSVTMEENVVIISPSIPTTAKCLALVNDKDEIVVAFKTTITNSPILNVPLISGITFYIEMKGEN